MTSSILYLDQAYSLADARRRNHLHFLEARNRHGIFDKVWSIHPLVGVMAGRWPKRLNWQSLGPDHCVIDGFIEGPVVPRLLQPLSLLWAQLRIVAEAARIVRRHSIDLIYASDCFYLGAFGLMVKWLTQRPLMVGIMANHDLAFETTGQLAYPRLLRSRRLEQWLQRRVLKHADWIEVVSEDGARYAIRYGADPAKLVRLSVARFIGKHHFTPPAERADSAPILTRLGIPAGRPTLLCVSRLRPVKYPLDALDAMRIAIEGVPEAIGMFAGEGELRAEMEARIRQWNLTDRIFLPGNIDQNSLAAVVPGCTILSPCTGMALIETSLAGGPPVVYDVDWQPEFVEDGVNGFVVPLGDSGAMGVRALRLLRDPALYKRMSRAIRERALAFADQDAFARAEREAFERILGGREPIPSPLRPGANHA